MKLYLITEELDHVEVNIDNLDSDDFFAIWMMNNTKYLSKILTNTQTVLS